METPDLCLAAYLVYNNFIGESIKIGNATKNQKVFVFGRKTGTKIEDFVMDFNNKRGQVEPKRYFAEIRDLKSMIYN